MRDVYAPAGLKTPPFRWSVLMLALGFALLPLRESHALSALKDVPGANGEQQSTTPSSPAPDVNQGLPVPDPLINGGSDNTAVDEGTEDTGPAPKPLNGGKPAPAIYDTSTLPAPVLKMRQALVEAAASGDIERLRPLLGTGKDATEIAVGETAGDPVNTLKELAGDNDGVEILSSMLNIMATGFVHVSVGTPDEAYVWPYFAAKPLNELTPPEKVELMRIVTAGDYQDMVDFGSYNFYRIGISPDGKWKFFSAGE